jgi:hypothetical protein
MNSPSPKSPTLTFTFAAEHRIDRTRTAEENEMDVVYIALIVGFFVASVGLIRFCAALIDKGGKS